MIAHHREQFDHPADVLAVVLQRHLDRLAGSLECRKVDHAGDLVLADSARKCFTVLESCLHERHIIGHSVPQTVGKIVDDNRIESGRAQ